MTGNQTLGILNMTTTSPTQPTDEGSGGGEADEEMQTIAMTYAVLVMLAIIGVTGTAGNALVIYVFSKRNDNQTSTIFIIGLAIVDMATCAIIVPFTMAMEYLNFSVEYDALCKIYHFLTTSNVPFSALIMSAIAVDRYLCICHPFLHAMNIKRAKICILCLGLFASVLGSIVAMMYGVYKRVPYKHCTTPSVNLTNSSGVAYTYSQHLCPLTVNESVSAIPSGQLTYRIKYVGVCDVDDMFIKGDAREAYQKIHVSVFLLCLLVVIVLYTLIYKSVLDRRRKRAKMKKPTAHLVVREPSIDCEETVLTTVNGSGMDKLHANNLSDSKRMKRKSTRRDRQTRMQNIKTAVMLFVVTVVFVITFLPAALMANNVITYVGIVFYMYFANNVANPVIYSFMNKNFRDDLKKIFNIK